MDISSLKRGDGIVVRVGSRGTQYALVEINFGEKLRVRKWLANGRRWTASRTIYPVEVLRRAELGEYRPSVPVTLR